VWQEAVYLKRKEEEAAAAAQAAAEAKIAAEARDAEAAAAAVAEIKAAYDSWRAGGAKEQAGLEGATLWRAKAVVAGKRATLLYNRTAGPLGAFPVPDDQRLMVRVGHNGWKSSSDVVLKRTKVAGAGASDGKVL
jgi:hypothetical protein